MTFAELKAEVFRRLRESTTSPVFWRDTDIEFSLNEGYAEITDDTEWNELSQVIPLLKNRQYYDMRTVARQPFLRCGAAFNLTMNRWLIPTQTREMDDGDQRWEQRVAEPDRLLIRGLWWVSYWPWKSVAVGNIRQFYIGLPDPMAEAADVPGFHVNFHYALVEYALWDLFAQDGEVDLAWAAWKRYLEYEEKLRQHRDRRSRIPLRHGLRPSEAGF